MLSFQWQCVAAAKALGHEYKTTGCYEDIGVKGCFLNGKPGEEVLTWNTCDKGKTSTNGNNMPVCTFKGCPPLARAPINCMDDDKREVCEWQNCEVCDTRCEINRRLPSDNFPLNPKSRDSEDTKIYRNFYLQLASDLKPGPSWTAEKGFAAANAGTSKCVAIGGDNKLVLKTSKANCDKIDISGKQLKARATYNTYKKDSFVLALDEDGCGVKVQGAALMATSSGQDCPGLKNTNWFDMKMIDGMDYGLSADNKMGGPFALQSKADPTKCVGIKDTELTLMDCSSTIAKFYWRAAVSR